MNDPIRSIVKRLFVVFLFYILISVIFQVLLMFRGISYLDLSETEKGLYMLIQIGAVFTFCVSKCGCKHA